MSEDWQRGDFALCVADSHKDNPLALSTGWNPAIGGIYRVAAVHVCASDDMVWGLDFAEDPVPVEGYAWDARDFRKVTPGAEIVGIEEARCAPVAVPA